MSYRLGVDLGTTFTAAAVANGMPPTMVGLGNRALQIPSVLFLTTEGELLAGESAERRGLAEPDRVVREFKRRIGDTVPLLLAGTPYSPQSLTARLLRHVVRIASERMGSAPEQIVLTHPANWGPFKLELLDEVARLADAGPVLRCAEPLGAAAQYAAQTRVEVGSTIAVYDLGGGTLDTCVLQKTSTGFALLGRPEGIEHLGGIDFDDALFQHVLDLLGDRLDSLDPKDPDITYRLARLRRDCVDAKEALSTDTETWLPIALPGLSTRLRLTRSEFEALVQPALEETVQALERTLRSADVTADQLSAIVLIGGSSRIPLVGELLHDTFATPIALDTHPKDDVVLGAIRSIDRYTAAGPPGPTLQGRHDNARPDTARPDTARPDTARPDTSASAPEDQEKSNEPPEPQASGPDGPVGTHRRRRVLLTAGTATLVVVTSVGVVTTLSRRDGDQRQAGTPGAGAAPSTTELHGLPVSAPLSGDQLVVPALADDNWDLWLADSGNAAPLRRLTTDPGPDTTPAISPDRRTVIYTHDLDTADRRTLLVKGASTAGDGRPLFDVMPPECRFTVFRPAWNPAHPSELAVPCVSATHKFGIYRITTRGRLLGRIRLPEGAVRGDDPSYSPDGKQLVFWASGPSTWDGGTLYTVAVDGGEPKQLVRTTREGEDADPVWSPDGDHVVFRRRLPSDTSAGNFDIFQVTTDGSARLQRLTTDESARDQDPAYSPSGRSIAYKSTAQDPNRPDNVISRIWVMDANGRRQRVLWSRGADAAQTAAGWGRR